MLSRHLLTLAPLAGALALSSACVSKKKYNALQADHADLQARHDAALDRQLSLRLDKVALEERVADLRAERSTLAAYYQDLLTDFGPAMERGDVTLMVYPDHTSLVFSDTMTFASNDADLTPQGEGVIETLAGLMKRHPDRNFEVQGHTDARPIAAGPFEDNWQLGAARALSVVETLIDHGVSAGQLSAATYASTEPVRSNRTADGRAMNRRVEIALRPDLSDIASHQDLIWSAVSRNAFDTPKAASTTSYTSVR